MIKGTQEDKEAECGTCDFEHENVHNECSYSRAIVWHGAIAIKLRGGPTRNRTWI